MQRRASNRYTWNFPDAIKFRVAAHTILEKAIRFRHPDYNPDRAQKLISSSISRHLSTRNISCKYMHAFLSNLTDRQTDRQTNERGQTYLSSPLSEVNNAQVLLVSKVMRWLLFILLWHTIYLLWHTAVKYGILIGAPCTKWMWRGMHASGAFFVLFIETA